MTSPRIEYLPDARNDFDESLDWYAERDVRAAERFADAVSETLERISATPEMFARIDQQHRECRVKRFPFRVVYRVTEECVVVVAVAHAKRRPDYWRERD